jgi:hypothetical protein
MNIGGLTLAQKFNLAVRVFVRAPLKSTELPDYLRIDNPFLREKTMPRSYKSSRAAVLVIAYYAALHNSEQIDVWYGENGLPIDIDTSSLFVGIALTELNEHGHLKQSTTKDKEGNMTNYYCISGKGAAIIEDYTATNHGYISHTTSLYTVLENINLEEFEKFLNNYSF